MEGSTEIHKLLDPQVDVEAFLRNQRRTLTLQMSNLAIGRQSFPVEDHKESSKVIIDDVFVVAASAVDQLLSKKEPGRDAFQQCLSEIERHVYIRPKDDPATMGLDGASDPYPRSEPIEELFRREKARLEQHRMLRERRLDALDEMRKRREAIIRERKRMKELEETRMLEELEQIERESGKDDLQHHQKEDDNDDRVEFDSSYGDDFDDEERSQISLASLGRHTEHKRELDLSNLDWKRILKSHTRKTEKKR